MSPKKEALFIRVPLRWSVGLGEEWLGKSNCIVDAVFGGSIKGCATGGGTVVDDAIVDGAILGAAMVGCAIVSIAIAGGANESGTIRGSTILHHCLACHHRQHKRRVQNHGLRRIRGVIIKRGGCEVGDSKDGGWGSVGCSRIADVIGGV